MSTTPVNTALANSDRMNSDRMSRDPLRTAAISGVFAMCLGLLVERPAPAARSATDLRPARHMVFR